MNIASIYRKSLTFVHDLVVCKGSSQNFCNQRAKRGKMKRIGRSEGVGDGGRPGEKVVGFGRKGGRLGEGGGLKSYMAKRYFEITSFFQQ